VQDVWLAAQAVQLKFTLLTATQKDFRDVPGLKFIEVKLRTGRRSVPSSAVP